MTTTKVEHTPGPWRVESRGGMNGREVRADATYVVATVNTTNNTAGNRLANARLIAAAPELLTVVVHAAAAPCLAADFASQCLHCIARAAIRAATETPA